MGLRFSQQQYGTCFFVTTTFKEWAPLGNLNGFYPALTESLVFCTTKFSVLIAGYVLMPTHIHLLIFVDGLKLSGFMRDFKKFIAQKVIRDLKGKGESVWMHRYDRVAIYSNRILREKLNYIHHNPVKAGLVKNSEDWEWSSARDYTSGVEGKIPVWKGWASP